MRSEALVTRSQPRIKSASPLATRNGGNVFRPCRDLEMGHHRAILLRDADHVDQRRTLALDMGRHAEDMADGYDTGAADPRDQNAPRLCERRQNRVPATRGNGVLVGTTLGPPLRP